MEEDKFILGYRTSREEMAKEVQETQIMLRWVGYIGIIAALLR